MVLLLLLLFIQYLLVVMDIAFEQTTKTRVKKDIIPFYGIYTRILRTINKLPK